MANTKAQGESDPTVWPPPPTLKDPSLIIEQPQPWKKRGTLPKIVGQSLLGLLYLALARNIIRDLIRAIAKGDPIDIAAYSVALACYCFGVIVLIVGVWRKRKAQLPKPLPPAA